jgi:hypothetical protein
MGREILPNELLWEADHASELAVSVLADGEESSLPRDVVSHVHSCDECAMKLGEVALVTRGVTHAVQSVKPWLPAAVLAPVSSKRRAAQPVPYRAIAVALFLAAAGAMPSVLALPRRVADLLITLSQAAPIVGHSGVKLFEHGLGSLWLTATCACAVLLVGAGVAATKLLPRPTTS